VKAIAESAAIVIGQLVEVQSGVLIVTGRPAG
jgi:hypothetical protein